MKSIRRRVERLIEKRHGKQQSTAEMEMGLWAREKLRWATDEELDELLVITHAAASGDYDKVRAAAIMQAIEARVAANPTGPTP